ncbi:hypothetical protein WDR10_11200 [Kurthia gibsonii]|uniref:hypothetical protein n=1 Tax=Kurthia gibsonii TaxID=33946 RepID=UPI0030CC6BF5
MSKKFIVFAGVIFIIVFGVIQIAVISTLGVNANINLDRTIAIFSGLFSLFGGVIGATGAYFIAREQIKKQESMKRSDLKLEIFIPVVKDFERIKSEIIKTLNDFEKFKCSLYMKEEFEELRKKSSEEVSKIWGNIMENSLYLKMAFPGEIDLSKIRLSSMSCYMDKFEDMKGKLAYEHADFYRMLYCKGINEAIETLEKEVENILLD